MIRRSKRWKVSFAAATCSLCLVLPSAVGQVPRTAEMSASILPTRRTIDGVEVLEYRPDALERAPQFTTAPIPLVVFGGADADPTYDLTWLSNAVLWPDGSIATFSQIGSKLFVFGRDGRPRRIIGRQGQGPGEFMAASGIVPGFGDSLILVDFANRRINWILADRGVVAERSLALEFHRQLSTVAGVLPNRLIVMSSAGRLQQGVVGQVTRPPASIGVLSSADGKSRLIAEVPDLPTAMIETRYSGRLRMTARPLRLGDRAHIAVWDTLIVTASGDSRIELRDSTGRVVQRLTIPAARRAVTPAMRRQIIDRELARLRGPKSEPLIDPAESERLAREAPFADSLPVVGNIFVGRDRVMWIVDPAIPGESTWAATGIAHDWSVVARVRGSGGVPIGFGPGRVLLRREDADGVVSLAAYGLVPRPR